VLQIRKDYEHKIFMVICIDLLTISEA